MSDGRSDLLDGLLDAEGADALIRIVVERLADLFEPKLVDVYAALFSEVIARVLPEFTADQLLARYQRVRQPRVFAGKRGCRRDRIRAFARDAGRRRGGHKRDAGCGQTPFS